MFSVLRTDHSSLAQSFYSSVCSCVDSATLSACPLCRTHFDPLTVRRLDIDRPTRVGHTSTDTSSKKDLKDHVVSIVRNSADDIYDVTFNDISLPRPISAVSHGVVQVGTADKISRIQPPQEELHPTLSSWLKNINKLDSLINRLQQLASSAPTDHRSQLLKKVAALRATFKKQQERCIEFLQLSEDYANKYLLDIDAEIRQQSTLLDNLEERLDAAKKLHGDAVELQKLYESGTVASMNDLRATGKAVPVICRLQMLQGRLLRPSIFRYLTAASTGRWLVQRG